MKKTLTVLLIISLLTTLPVIVFAAPPAGKGGGGGTTNQVYTAIGDSIAVGVGATNNFGYVNYFHEHLTQKLGTVDLNNKAKSGIDTSGLLFQLSVDKGTQNAIKNAKIITISIGGNNILSCANADYTSIDEVCAANGAKQFATDWPKILEKIRNIKKLKATDPIPGLYVMTLYNPYMASVELDLFNKADLYIEDGFSDANGTYKGINGIIRDSAADSYTVADVYNHFTVNNNDKMNEWTHFYEADRDVHPTDLGHQEISNVHEAFFQ
jgi:lysophospholipase L1-like esterase